MSIVRVRPQRLLDLAGRHHMDYTIHLPEEQIGEHMVHDPFFQRWAPVIGCHDIAAKMERLGFFRDKSPTDIAYGAMACLVIYGLARHAALGRPSPVFVEIGVQGGVSTSILLLLAEEMDGRVVSMDPEIVPGTRERLAGLGLDLNRWTMYDAKSQDVEPVQDADFLLVDGDHNYPAVCSDMARHGAAVRVGGGVLLDDVYVGWYGKTRWTLERWRDIAPVTIGPLAYVVRRPGIEAAFQRVYPDMAMGSGFTWEI